MGLRSPKKIKNRKEEGMMLKKHLYPISLFVISVVCWLVNFSALPEEVPIHWGKNGADGFESKGVAFFTLHAIMFFIYVLMMVIPIIDPKKKNFKYFSKSFMIINYALVSLFFVINMIILLIGLGVNIPMERLAGPLVGALFLILGNYLQQARANFFIGIRTPWTLSDDEVWRKTHRLGGKLFMGGGLIIMLTVLMPLNWEFYIITGVVAIVVIVPTVYSYLLFQKIVKE